MIINTIIQQTTQINRLYIFGFLIMLGVLTYLLSHTGALHAYTRFIQRFIKTPYQAQLLSPLLSLTLFLDDYLSNITVGTVMRPITDSFAIPRAKLAFLVDSLSGPLCILVPFTSWAVEVTLQLETTGFHHATAYNTYVASIPFLLYPIFIIATAFIIPLLSISYGTMQQFEGIAQKTGNLFGGKKPIGPTAGTNHTSPHAITSSIYDFVLPIAVFLGAIIINMLYFGGWTLLGGNLSLIDAFAQAGNYISKILCLSAGMSLATGLLYFIAQQKLSWHGFITTCKGGFMLMKNSLLLLTCAWTFASILTNQLHTGTYVSNFLMLGLTPFIAPLTFFGVAALLSASIGSAWGTISILIPLAIPLTLTPAYAPIGMIILGALLSGAVAGSHLSPITDAMVMTASSTGCYLLDHVQTQIIYAMPAIIGTASSFLIMGFLGTSIFVSSWLLWLIGLATGLTVMMTTLLLKNRN
jgi:Na+/H+ antiporter NhaC